ncbi:MAG TPA: DUF3617 family protein [Dongiaceae bacterium]|nr:DUF3617 family protein [Dongiaceae bacterium]
MIATMLALQVLVGASTMAQIRHAQAQEMQPGQWHIVTQGSTVVNGQKTDLPENEMDSCVSPDQAKQASDLTRQPQEDGCKTELLWRGGSKAKTRTTCPNSVATSDIDLAGNAYRSATHMEMHQGNTPVVTDMMVTGTRMSDCTR